MWSTVLISPLNVSRETMQDSELLRKLGQVLTKRFIDFLTNRQKRKKRLIWSSGKNLGHLLKKGWPRTFTYKDDLAKLLRFRIHGTEDGKLTGLDAYIDRMAAIRKKFFFSMGKTVKQLNPAPTSKLCKHEDMRFLLLTEPVDEYVMQSLREFKEKKIISADSDELKLEKLDQEPTGEALIKRR